MLQIKISQNLENLTEMRNFLEASADFIKKSLAEGKPQNNLLKI
jgi:hypothetical protein